MQMTPEVPLHVIFTEAWIQKDDTFLLAKRSSKDDQAAGKWSPPWGKVDMEVERNIIENTLKREIMEEVGIEISDEIQYFDSWSFIRSSGHHVVGLAFLATYKSGTAEPLEDQDEVRWVTIEEMRVLLDTHYTDTLNKLERLVGHNA